MAIISSTTVGQLITAACAMYPNVSTSLLSSILNAENSSFNTNAVSSTKVQGFAQIEQATWTTYAGGAPYSTDPAAQLDLAAKILSTYVSQFGGNVALIAAAYNGGPGVSSLAEKLIALNPSLSIADAISQATAQIYSTNAGKVTEVNNYVTKVSGTSATASQAVQASNYTNQNTPFNGVDNSAAIQAVPLLGTTYNAAQVQALLTAIDPSLIDLTGTTQASWEVDPAIVSVNSVTRVVGDPVTFTIAYDNGVTVLPFTINLNASVSSFKRAMRANNQHENTRTGTLLTLWGMTPDIISGEASTGIFMNQLGITDFLSVAGVPSSVLQVVQADLGIDTAYSLTEGNLRVAAKDAFIELLSAFKNNGTVWFENSAYNGYTTGQQQLAPNAWSPVTGFSTFQAMSRRNDVRTRGSVTMNFRNAAYSGYFQSLSWSLSATKPFEWNFSFTFKVESTTVSVEVPT
jgi:hypothetical protein